MKAIKKHSSRAIVSVASKNYLAQARTLFESVAKFHADADLILLLADESEGKFKPEKEGFSVLEAKEMEIPEFIKTAFIYDVLELNTALKPFFMRYLFSLGYEKLIYLDPDIMVFDSLGFIFDMLDQYSMILTPHITEQLPQEDKAFPQENCFLLHGTYNLGFLGLRDSEMTADFITWWSRKCAREGFIEPFNGLFVDQKWLNLVPCLYESVYTLRHPGCNMAHWNLHERILSGKRVNGKDNLIFFHFSSFPFDNIDLISNHQNRYSLSDRPDLIDLFEEYRDNLSRNGYRECSKWPYKYALFDNGIPLDPFIRRLFTIVSGQCDEPFAVGKGSYFDMLKHKGFIHTRFSSLNALRTQKSPQEYKKFSKIINALLRFSAKAMGSYRYSLFMQYLHQSSVVRKQDFLLK